MPNRKAWLKNEIGFNLIKIAKKVPVDSGVPLNLS